MRFRLIQICSDSIVGGFQNHPILLVLPLGPSLGSCRCRWRSAAQLCPSTWVRESMAHPTSSCQLHSFNICQHASTCFNMLQPLCSYPHTILTKIEKISSNLAWKCPAETQQYFGFHLHTRLSSQAKPQNDIRPKFTKAATYSVCWAQDPPWQWIHRPVKHAAVKSTTWQLAAFRKLVAQSACVIISSLSLFCSDYLVVPKIRVPANHPSFSRVSMGISMN